MTAMTIERAVDNAIVSTEMEGFAMTEKHKELIMKLMIKEITLEEALKELKKKGWLWHIILKTDWIMGISRRKTAYIKAFAAISSP